MTASLLPQFEEYNDKALLNIIPRMCRMIQGILICLGFFDFFFMDNSKNLILSRLFFLGIFLFFSFQAKSLGLNFARLFSFMVGTVAVSMNFVFNYIILTERLMGLEVAIMAHILSLVLSILGVVFNFLWSVRYSFSLSMLSILGQFLSQRFILEENYNLEINLVILGVSVFIVTTWSRISGDLRLKNFEVTTKLKASYQNLKKINEFKNRLIANVGHELRTPLQLIIGPVKSLLEEPSGKNLKLPQVIEVLKSVQRNTYVLLDMVRDFLDISKLEVKKQKLCLEKVDLVIFLRRYYENFKLTMASKNITLDFKSKCEKAVIYLDLVQFHKIISNLLSNAFKFTEKNGSVKIILDEKDNSYLVQVQDTGIGIEPTELPLIFDRFFQANMSNNRHYEGSGLGLSLVKEFVHLHKMKITVKSKPKGQYPVDHGSLFSIQCPKHQGSLLKAGYTLILPKDSSSEATILSQDVESHPPQNLQEIASKKNLKLSQNFKREKILIIEDNFNMRKYLLDNFNKHFKIYLASSGEEALRVTKKVLPDLIISDIMMPGMDGNEMLKRMKKDRKLKDVPIIFLTANTTQESRVKSFAMGVIDYIVKPFEIGELQAKIKNLLSFKKYVIMKEKAREERKLRKKMEEIYRSRENFFSVLSHEIRSPVSIIQMRFERYMMQANKPEISIPFGEVRALYERSKIIGEQFNAILDLAKYTSGRKKMMIEEASIVQFISEFIKENRPIAKGEGIDLYFENHILGDDAVYIDKDEIKKALQNLFTNAIRYKHDKKSVQNFIKLKLEKEAKSYLIYFKDNGVGIPEEDMPFIFEKFVQTKHSIKNNFKGKRASTGLGLNIARKAINANGGWISVESNSIDDTRKEHGTCFSIKLPIGNEHFLRRTDVVFMD